MLVRSAPCDLHGGVGVVGVLFQPRAGSSRREFPRVSRARDFPPRKKYLAAPMSCLATSWRGSDEILSSRTIFGSSLRSSSNTRARGHSPHRCSHRRSQGPGARAVPGGAGRRLVLADPLRGPSVPAPARRAPAVRGGARRQASRKARCAKDRTTVRGGDRRRSSPKARFAKQDNDPRSGEETSACSASASASISLNTPG